MESVQNLKRISLVGLYNGIFKASKLCQNLTQEPIERIVADIRKDYLAHSYSQIRKWLLQEFCKQRSRGVEPNPHLWFFLDCVLDESFTDVDLLSTLSPTGTEGQQNLEYKFDSKLLAMISHRCPLIKEVKLVNKLKINTPALESIFVTSVTSLKHLTKLDINCTMNYSCANLLFTQLGDACPELTCLNLHSDIPFETEQIFNLILGKRAALLPQSVVRGHRWHEQNIYLQFDEESTTRICKSLKYLYAIKEGRHEKNVIFLLRHLTQLEEINLKNDNTSCMGLLAEMKRENPVSDVIHHHREDRRNGLCLQWTTNSPLPRTSHFFFFNFYQLEINPLLNLFFLKQAR